MFREPAAWGSKVIPDRYEPAPVNIDIPPAKLIAGVRSAQTNTAPTGEVGLKRRAG